MPELPEVETVARGLRAVLPGRRILSVRLGKTDFIEDPPAIERELPGLLIANVRRHGKFLLFDLESSNGTAPKRENGQEKGQELALMIHLGMTGQLVTSDPGERVPPHTHVFFGLDDGRELRYTDVRRFGQIRLLSGAAHKDTLNRLGLDPLEATEAEFRAMLHGRRARIKALLLDQRFLRGMGNIYTDESLWRARINPTRLGANLSDKEIRKLYRAMREVLMEAIKLRGSSVSDYVDACGERGSFQTRHRVYQRKGKKCFRCGTSIRRAIVAGRSSYFCPGCQKAPRARAKRS
jgi:formamidopyrimidine-DNA glycosylase